MEMELAAGCSRRRNIYGVSRTGWSAVCECYVLRQMLVLTGTERSTGWPLLEVVAQFAFALDDKFLDGILNTATAMGRYW
jgi:hypothetical protein